MKNIKYLTCPCCDGTGQDTEEGLLSDIPCPECEGTGLLEVETVQVQGEVLRVTYMRY